MDMNFQFRLEIKFWEEIDLRSECDEFNAEK